MTYSGIQAALDARLQTLPGFVAAQCAWEGHDFSPSVGTPWLATQMLAITRSGKGAGEKGVVYWNGLYQVSCYWPIGQGVQPAAAQVDAVLAIYKRGTTLTATDGTRVICDVPPLRPPIIDDEWVKGIALVDWFSYEFPA